MERVLVTVVDRSGVEAEREVEAGATAGSLFSTRDVVAARIGGRLRDLATPLVPGDRVEEVAIDSPDGLYILRHSTAHVLAQAVQGLFPAVKLGIGPPIDN